MEKIKLVKDKKDDLIMSIDELFHSPYYYGVQYKIGDIGPGEDNREIEYYILTQFNHKLLLVYNDKNYGLLADEIYDIDVIIKDNSNYEIYRFETFWELSKWFDEQK